MSIFVTACLRGIRSAALPLLPATALAVLIGAAQPAPVSGQEGEPREAQTATHRGEVQAVSGDTLTMTIDGANEHTHRVAEDARVTLNGRRVDITMLRRGDSIEVSTPRNDPNVATAIAATRDRDETGERPVQDDERAELRRPRGADEPQGRAGDEPRQRPRDEFDGRAAQDHQPPAALDRVQRQNEPQVEPQDRRSADAAERRRVERGELGVSLQAAEQGVRVSDVAPQSAAAQAGLRRGDYLLAIDDRPVDDPRQVRQLIGELRAGDELTLVVWRDGQRFRTRATLEAARAFDGFRRDGFDAAQEDRAWLGVALSAASADARDERGARIESVYPTSPAAEAGLHSGDRILAADDRQFESTEAFTQYIRQKSSGDEVTLSVATEDSDEPQQVKVTLASRNEYLGGDSRPATDDNPLYAIPEYAMRMEQDRRMAECQKRMEELMLELLKEVRELRKEVDALKSAPRESP